MRSTSDTWLRSPADRRSLVFLAATLAMLVVPLLQPVPPVLAAPWIAVSTVLCFSVCIINHNHVHCPMFRSDELNRLLDIVLSVAKGHSANGVVVAHNLNHHRYNGGPGDWIRTDIAGTGPGAWRLLRYVVAASLAMARGRNAADAPVLAPAIGRSLLRERAALLAFALGAVAFAGTDALLFVGVPWLLAMTALVAVNLLQHDGCRPHPPHDQARNFTGRLGNWLFFNNGYHTAHHLHPAAHWSTLPDLHARQVRPHMDPRLEQRSILGFLLHHYLLAGPARSARLAGIEPPRAMPGTSTTGTVVPERGKPCTEPSGSS